MPRGGTGFQFPELKEAIVKVAQFSSSRRAGLRTGCIDGEQPQNTTVGRLEAGQCLSVPFFSVRIGGSPTRVVAHSPALMEAVEEPISPGPSFAISTIAGLRTGRVVDPRRRPGAIILDAGRPSSHGSPVDDADHDDDAADSFVIPAVDEQGLQGAIRTPWAEPVTNGFQRCRDADALGLGGNVDRVGGAMPMIRPRSVFVTRARAQTPAVDFCEGPGMILVVPVDGPW